MNHGVRKSQVLVWSWNKINKPAGKDVGRNVVVMTAHTPDGSIFSDGVGTLTISATAFDGATDIRDIAAFTWYRYEQGWQEFKHLSDNIGYHTVTVNADDVNSNGLFKCVMRYKGDDYSSIPVLFDSSDTYTLHIASTGGTSFSRTGIATTLMCNVYR